MDKAKLLADLDGRPEAYKKFTSIPVELQDSETAVTWMACLCGGLGIYALDTLPQIPDELRNQSVFLKAVGIDGRALKLIKPSQTDDYLAIALAAVLNNSDALQMIDDNYKTEAVLDLFIAHKVYFDLDTSQIDWIKPMINQDRIDKLSANGFWFALEVGLENVSWDVVKDTLKTIPDWYTNMDKQGQLGFLTKMLKENEWPISTGCLTYKPLKNLADGVSRLMRAGNDTMLKCLYKAYVMTHPVEDVIAAMKTPNRREMLLKMYSLDDLRPHAHGDRNLRGKILEQEMGL